MTKQEFTERVNNTQVSLTDMYLDNGVTFREAVQAMCTMSALGLLSRSALNSKKLASQLDVVIEVLSELIVERVKKDLCLKVQYADEEALA